MKKFNCLYQSDTSWLFVRAKVRFFREKAVTLQPIFKEKQ